MKWHPKTIAAICGEVGNLLDQWDMVSSEIRDEHPALADSIDRISRAVDRDMEMEKGAGDGGGA